jgi:hypothetical protein
VLERLVRPDTLSRDEGRITMLRQSVRAIRLGAALATCVVVACSSFGSTDDSTTPATEAGVEGAVADGAAEGGAICANVTTDPMNCGRCGHDCLGGACAAGVCQPLLVASFTDQPVGSVVLSQDHVFWNTMQDLAGGPGNVYSCPKVGCAGAFTVLPAVGNVVRNLGSDGAQKVYAGAFYGGGGLFEVGPKSMGSRLTNLEGGNPMQMSVRPDALFYVSFFESPTGSTIRRWNYAGAITIPCAFATGETTSSAAFTTGRAYLFANGAGKLYSCPLVGTSGQFVSYRDNLYLSSLTATADRVFWAVDGSVISSADGDTSTSISAELSPQDVGSNVTTVTVTGGDLLVTTAGGEVWACAPNDCKATRRRIAAEAKLDTLLALTAHTVAADAEAVYYVAIDASADGGLWSSRLMKVAR